MYNLEKPQVVTWYHVYCGAMVLLYLLVAVMGAVFVFFADDMATGDEPPEQYVATGVMLGGMGVVLLVAFAIGLFLPRSPGAWTYGIVLIALGLTSVCCLPATLPLLIFWVKPQTQQYYGKGPKQPPWEDWR